MTVERKVVLEDCKKDKQRTRRGESHSNGVDPVIVGERKAVFEDCKRRGNQLSQN